MKKYVALKKMTAPFSKIKVKMGSFIWPGRKTNVNEAEIRISRGKAEKKREFVVKRSHNKDPHLKTNSFAQQVDIHNKIINAMKRLDPSERKKLRVVPTLRLGLGENAEQFLIRTKLDAIPISQFGKKYPNEIKRYSKELNEAVETLKKIGFTTDIGAFSAVRGKDEKYHPMLIDFDFVSKR